MTETRWTDELDPVRRELEVAPNQPGTELLPLADRGELVVRPETALERALATPSGARAVALARGSVSLAGRAARVTGRAVLTATVTAPAPRAGRALARFAGGRPFVGAERTDATFWRDGRLQPREVPGTTSSWAYKSRAKRSATRLGSLLVVWGVAALVAPRETFTATAFVGAVLAVWACYGLVGARQRYRHRRDWLLPLHDALASIVGQRARPEEWLHVPPTFKTDGAEIRIDLPKSFGGGDKGAEKLVASIVVAKLGLDDGTRVAWHLAGNTPYAIFRQPARPPAKVTIDDLMPLLSKARETAPIIGLAAGDHPVTVDLEADSPHVLISAGSGAGKSVLIRTILAQGLAKGGYGIIFDVKRVSHMWAANMSNCEYHRTAEAIHERLLRLRGEVDRRTALVEQYADIDGNVDHIDVGPRIWVIAEEMNATINRLNNYWREIKEKSDPNISPAVEALLDLLFMGRQIKIHVVSVAQLATARTLGGPEARENFATRCLARYTVNAWRMLCPEVWPAPKKSAIKGRWQIVANGKATETQVAFFTPAQARELAQKGLDEESRTTYEPPAPPVSQESHDRDDLGQAGETVLGQSPDADSPADSPESLPASDDRRLVSLRDAVEEGIIDDLSLDALRKAQQRDVHFPKSRGTRGSTRLYDVGELGLWYRNRRTTSSDEE